MHDCCSYFYNDIKNNKSDKQAKYISFNPPSNSIIIS